MIAGPVFVTPHAVEQFRARVAPDLSYEEALGAIIRALSGQDGKVSFRASTRGVVARARRGTYSFRAVIVNGKPSPVCVTILRSGT